MFAEWRPPTTTMRSTSRAVSRVSSWRRMVTGQTVFMIRSSWARETMNAASFSNFQGGWVDWVMSAIRLRRGIRSQSSSSSTTIASGANPSRPTTSGCLGVPSRTIVYPSATSSSSWRCSWITQVQVPSMISRPRDSARSNTSGLTPWARITTAAPWSTSSSESTARTPSCWRLLITPSLCTTWPSVCVALPAAADSFALSMASRTP